MPVHPLKGQRLRVVKWERDQQGRRYAKVEHPAGGGLRIPLEWTDRVVQMPTPRVGNDVVRVDIAALLKLVGAYEGLSIHPLAITPASAEEPGDGGMVGEKQHVRASGGVDSVTHPDKAERAGGVGRVGAASAARRG